MRGRGTAPAERGFTLVELLYVMILIGILTGIAVPLLDTSRFRLDAAVREVSTGLMAAQRAAVLGGHDMVVTFDEDNRWLRIHYDLDNDGSMETGENYVVRQLPDGVVFGRGGAPKLSNDPNPVTFETEQDDFPTLVFHRNGSASEEGYIYLTSEGSDPGGEHARAVQVARATGRVRCWSYRTGSWQETC